ncbi:MAG: TIGR01906 family membrane protein [Oscillospiraceae bacterium]|nr:TIGR01906 family membrane protein [Oscillospiraceae bacterium]
MKAKTLTALQAILIAVVILSGAIAAPVLCRPFYYLHIRPLDLPEVVGLTAEQIKTAYNEMMDFCIGISDDFSVGALAWSEEGKAHFADVRKLFVLDLWALIASAVLLTAVTILRRKNKVLLKGHAPGFWGSVGLGVCFALVGGLATLDFNKAFEIFHKLFFPGKDNWLFDPRQDPIILALPEAFFRNCAILILALILIPCGILVGYDLAKKRKQ